MIQAFFYYSSDLENCLTYKQRENMLAIILAVWAFFKQLLMRQSKLVFVEIWFNFHAMVGGQKKPKTCQHSERITFFLKGKKRRKKKSIWAAMLQMGSSFFCYMVVAFWLKNRKLKRWKRYFFLRIFFLLPLLLPLLVYKG